MTITETEIFNNIKNFKPEVNAECIVAISRGGLIPAQYFAYKYNIKNIIIANIESYEDSQTQSEVLKFKNLEEFKIKIAGFKNILVVDDIADSGRTLEAVNDAISDDKNTMYYTIIGGVKLPKIKNLHYSVKHDGSWVHFPWDLF